MMFYIILEKEIFVPRSMYQFCNNHFDYIIIICQTLRCWIRHDDNFWLIEPKYKLFQWKLPLLLARLETLFITDDAIADESLGKRDNPH